MNKNKKNEKKTLKKFKFLSKFSPKQALNETFETNFLYNKIKLFILKFKKSKIKVN